MSRARSRNRRCAHCDYDLTWLGRGSRCPECGSRAGAETQHDAVLLNLYRATAGICCWVLVGFLAAHGMYLDIARQVADPRAAELPAWWWMLTGAVVPIAAAWFVATRIRRLPTRPVVWAGAVFWVSLAGAFFVSDAIDPDSIIRTYAPTALAAGFLVTALIARRWR